MSLTDTIWTVIAAGGGGAVVAFGVVRVFGEKWLDNKFANRLQDLRHEHERQMESIRLNTAHTLDRSVRLSEREFECSAEAWSLVFDAYVRTMSALPGFRQYDDLSKLSDELARVVANKNEFEEWETEALLAFERARRNSYFTDRKRAHELRDARVAVRDASNFIDRKALFLDKNVYEKCKALSDFAWKAIVAREIIMEVGPGGAEGIRRDDNDFRENAEARIVELEQILRSRFWGDLPVQA